MARSVTLHDLYFGKASAEAEAAENASRFLRTYYDRWGLGGRLHEQPYFWIVGPKGSGKSAVKEFLRLSLIEQAGEHAVFSRTLNLDEVSPNTTALTSLTGKLVTSAATGVTDAAWRLYLALRLFELAMEDHGSSLSQDPQVLRLRGDLQRNGLTEADFPNVLRKVREDKMSFSIKGLLGGERSVRELDELNPTQLGEALVGLVVGLVSDSHYLLAIDGLDRIISDNDAYWVTLAALLRVSDDLHRRLQSATADVRLLVMCRSDVFRKIKFADADKIAGDAALFVDWGAHQTIPRDSHLWDYICAKAEITPEQLFSLLPDKVAVGTRGSRPRDVQIHEYLLQFTRSTPREMTMLLKRLQEEVPKGGYASGERVRLAADNFASRDLLTIVQAEATGLMAELLQDSFEEILSALPTATHLTAHDLRQSVASAGLEPLHASALAEFLFAAGLLGNFDPATGHVQFYHRRDTYKFKRHGPWTLHRGLMYAFNIPYSRG